MSYDAILPSFSGDKRKEWIKKLKKAKKKAQKKKERIENYKKSKLQEILQIQTTLSFQIDFYNFNIDI